MLRWQQLVATVLIVGIGACASLEDKEWVQKTRAVTIKAANVVTGSTSRTAKRMEKYLKEKDLLQTFQDAGEHSEAAVLDVLHKAGIGNTAPGKDGAAPAPLPKNPPPGAPTAPQQFAGTLRWPLDAGIVSSEFGKRKGKMHKGMDIAADVGEPVYASADADVIYAGNGLSGYGNVVILRHDQQMTSLYAHNSELKVKVGDRVKQGTQIALLGNTGRSTGPHVHFEIREGDAPINPRVILRDFKLANGEIAWDRLARKYASASEPRFQRDETAQSPLLNGEEIAKVDARGSFERSAKPSSTSVGEPQEAGFAKHLDSTSIEHHDA